MNWRILQAMLLLNILTLSTVNTAGAGEGTQPKQVVFPELSAPVQFIDDPISALKIEDFEFTPDNQSLLLLASTNLYRLDLETGKINFLSVSPTPGESYRSSMDWINDNKQLIFSNASRKILQWPSLELVKENWYFHTISLDRRTMLYQKSKESPYFLLNPETGEEEEVVLPSALQYVDINPIDRTVTYTWGITNTYDHGSSDSGIETRPIFLTTWSFASQSEIHTATLEGAWTQIGGGAWSSYYSHIFIFDQFELQSKKYMLGVYEGSGNRILPNVIYIPFIWDRETGSSMNSALWETGRIEQFALDQIPFGVSPDSRWFVAAVSNSWMKVIPFENRLKGIIDIGIGPFPKGNFAFSHDSKRLAVYYPITEDIRGEYRMAIIDLAPTNSVNDFPVYGN